MSREQKRERWREVIGAWRESGLSRAAFCRERGLSTGLLRYWLERLADSPSPRPRRAATLEVEEPGGFVELAGESVGGSGVRLRLGNGLLIEVEPCFDGPTLQRVLAVAGGQC